jgi:hypothetical protein
MNTLLVRWSAVALVLGLFAALSSGCVVPGDGYGYGYDNGPNIDIGVGYYEPYGDYYGGWGSGYRVGPTRGDNYRPDYGGRATPHAYRAAPISRPVPSIPARRRSGNLRHQPLQ